MSIEIIIGFYVLLFYFVVLAPKGTYVAWFVVMGYFMALLLLFGAPTFGIAAALFVFLCQRIRRRKDEGKSILPNRLRRKTQVKDDYATKALRDFAVMLDKGEREDYEQTIGELSDKKQKIKAQEERIRRLLEENEYLKKKQEQEAKISEATPRLRHYKEQAKKQVEQEEIELEKMKRKRMEEEIRRLKNLDNE